jgi:hypothetical protein
MTAVRSFILERDNEEIEAELPYDYSHLKLVNSAPILAADLPLFGRSSDTLPQKDAESGFSVDTQQKLGKKLHKSSDRIRPEAASHESS